MIKPISFGDSKVNIIYFNDNHGSKKYLDSFKTAFDEFQDKYEGEANYCLSGGDLIVDESVNNLSLIDAMNEILDAADCGNHDLEGQNAIENFFNRSKFAWLACNLKFSKDTPIENCIKKSVIIKKNGEKLGVIGAAPIDLSELSCVKGRNDLITSKTFQSTLKTVKKEVERLEKQGINKIVLLAHTGNKGKDGTRYYEELAKLGGVDVIIGGHDHLKTDFWTKSVRNEPVKVVATGKRSKNSNDFEKNLDKFGILNLAFDDDGVLIKNKSKNKFFNTPDFKPCDFVSKFAQKDSEPISRLKKALTCSSPLTEENKTADIAADASLYYVLKNTKGEKPLFSMVNSGTIRANFDKQEITASDINEVVPFTSSRLIKTTLTKKQIVNTLNCGVDSTKLPKISLGLMQVSGMTYEIGKNGKVKNIKIVDRNNKVIENLDEQPDDKVYTCVYDDYLMTGIAGLKDLKKDKNDPSIEYFNCSKQKALTEYLAENQGEDLWNIDFVRIKKD